MAKKVLVVCPHCREEFGVEMFDSRPQSEGLVYEEMCRQEYGGNDCVFSAGFVTGDSKPAEDTVYLCLEKEGTEPTILLLRPDEMQAIAWVVSGTLWSYLMGEDDGTETGRGSDRG